MLIPIRSGAADDDDDTPQEWSLLELNGELIPPPGGTSTVANTTSGTGGTRMELGSVRFASDGTPIMTLGSHELKGRVEDLKQPFVVMKKKKRKRDGDGSGGGGGDDGGGDCSSEMDIDSSASAPSLSGAAVSYEVAGVVKKKMMFDNYPKSIMR